MFKASVRSTSVQITASHDFVRQIPTSDEGLAWSSVAHMHYLTHQLCKTPRPFCARQLNVESLMSHVSTSASAKKTELVFNLELIMNSSLPFL